MKFTPPSKAPEGQKYQTKDGCEVTQVTEFDVNNHFTIRGVLDGVVQMWTADGSFGIIKTDYDLIDAPETKTMTVYLYDKGISLCSDKDVLIYGRLIASTKVEFTVGEFADE